MGMLNNFLAGAANTAGDLYAKDYLLGQQEQARINEINAASAADLRKVEAIRQGLAERVQKYYQPVTSTVPGVAAAPGAFDYEGEDGPAGNPVATEDTTTTRDATHKEAMARALQAGDMGAATAIEGLQHKDETIENLKERERNRLLLGERAAASRETAAATRAGGIVQAAKIRADSGEKIAGMRWLDEDGNPKKDVKDLTKEELILIRHDLSANNTEIRDKQKLLDDVTGPNTGGLRGDVKLKRIADLTASLTALRGINAKLHDDFGEKIRKVSVPKSQGVAGDDPSLDALYGYEPLPTATPSPGMASSVAPPAAPTIPMPLQATKSFLDQRKR